MSEKYVWLKRGQNFAKTENDFKVLNSELPKGIYRPICDSLGNWSLECMQDSFEFKYKIYDIENDFIKHVLSTWNQTNRNLGIMLNGIKGTGKSVTGKIIANATNLPVILVECSERSDPAPLVNYLKTVDFDCVFFFDEYEKSFKEGNDVLTLMDGMYSDLSRKMFILTTNNRWINDNLIARPSRIRYFKQFNDIDIKILSAYIDDNLIDKSRKEELLKFLDQLKDCTIDIAKAVVEEVNMHNCSLDVIEKYMNLTKETYKYQVYYVEQGTYDVNTLTEFIEKCAKIGTPGKNRYDNDVAYLTSNDLGLGRRTYDFYKKYQDLEIGDFMDDDCNYKIIDKRDDYLQVENEYNDVYFFKVNNSQFVNSLYGTNLIKYIY